MPKPWFLSQAGLIASCFSLVLSAELTLNLKSNKAEWSTGDISSQLFPEPSDDRSLKTCWPVCGPLDNLQDHDAHSYQIFTNTSHDRSRRAALRFEDDAWSGEGQRPRRSRSSGRQSRLTSDWDATRPETPVEEQRHILANAAQGEEQFGPEGEPRYLSPQAIATLSETLGAINTVGRYLVNYTRADKSAIQHIKPQPTVAKPSEELPNALYTISKNVLGRNMTDTIAPIVRGVAPLVQLSSSGKVVVQESGNGEGAIRPCTTPDGIAGNCQDLSNCPQLLLNLNNLRQSICFKSLFVPGVCCPTKGNQQFLTERPVLIEHQKPQYTTSTTRRPVINSAPSNVAPPVVSVPIHTTDASSAFLSEDCGEPEVPKFRVVGGEESLPGRWPWMAAIFLHGPRRTEFWCGGSLIGERHILTAAHCTRDNRQRPFSARQFTVRLGDIDLRRDDEPSAPETYGVLEVRAHPRFSRVGFYNDIAVLVLDRPVKRSRYVIPVCLPTENLKDEPFTGRNPTVVGWGTTYYGGKESTVQRQAELPIWNNAECDKTYFQPITENFLCAGLKEGGKDACQGDSGGPLLLKQGSHWMQVGIVSFGNKCGEPGYPGVYTRVSKYLDWLKDNVT
ncbi:unnamed protein product [Bemisia tabaci]|uniref:Proclotting enzyme n=1 Tax=Bemisia tabaci TaxID=7038 RepID=A0A9P0G495_BEMTA|nr:unnamed protein product [Bemisia tabaci]